MSGWISFRNQSWLMQTEVVPRLRKPSLVAAALERSMMRLPWNGPRSLMVTWTSSPVRWSTTETLVPKGRERCAAVMAFSLKISPDAARFPLKPGPYQEAPPHWA